MIYSQMVRQRKSTSQAMTLIEVLIATTLTLLMMLALAQGFRALSQSVSEGRSRLTLSDQLRGISELMRNDLAGVTVDNKIPQKVTSANGYFKYLDGEISDCFPMLESYNPLELTGEKKLSASRWGDIDDILAFTARAQQGNWFRGKVPQALIWISNLNNGIPVLPNDATPTAAQWEAAWLTDVPIASEYAEIIWYMRPLNENNSVEIQEIPVNGSYANTPPNTPSTDVAITYVGTNTSVATTDGMPDRLALCRRVMLIRPDLNIVPNGRSAGALLGDAQLTMQPLPLNTNNVDSFKFSMRFAYQRSDLSVRPYFDGTRLTLASNSLSDLQKPENRFGHYVLPMAAVGGGDGTSLPKFALTRETISWPRGYANGPSLRFIPSSFMRTKIVLDTNTGVPTRVSPTLEEIVGSNVLAFDVKGWDPAFKLLASTGPDGSWGAPGDDNNSGGDDPAEVGFPGTDDFAMTSSEAGYGVSISRWIDSNGSIPLVDAGSGAFVDAGWAWKLFGNRYPYVDVNNGQVASSVVTPAIIANLSTAQKTFLAPLFTTNLSGVELNATLDPIVNRTLIGSGGWDFFSGVPGDSQIAYDTFTDGYELDGDFQENTANGVVWRQGLNRLGLSPPTPPSPFADRGSDGIGEDTSEKETSPPFPNPIPAVQVTIRVQDVPATTLQQTSVTQDL